MSNRADDRERYNFIADQGCKKMSDTKTRILETGLRLWRADQPITARRIARELDMTHGTVVYHFSRGDKSLRDAIAYHCVEQGESKVIAALILEKHAAVAHMGANERMEHLRSAC